MVGDNRNQLGMLQLAQRCLIAFEWEVNKDFVVRNL